MTSHTRCALGRLGMSTVRVQPSSPLALPQFAAHISFRVRPDSVDRVWSLQAARLFPVTPKGDMLPQGSLPPPRPSIAWLRRLAVERTITVRVKTPAKPFMCPFLRCCHPVASEAKVFEHLRRSHAGLVRHIGSGDDYECRRCNAPVFDHHKAAVLHVIEAHRPWYLFKTTGHTTTEHLNNTNPNHVDAADAADASYLKTLDPLTPAIPPSSFRHGDGDALGGGVQATGRVKLPPLGAPATVAAGDGESKGTPALGTAPSPPDDSVGGVPLHFRRRVRVYKVGPPELAFVLPAVEAEKFADVEVQSMRFLPLGSGLQLMNVRHLQAEISFGFWDILDQLPVRSSHSDTCASVPRAVPSHALTALMVVSVRHSPTAGIDGAERTYTVACVEASSRSRGS